MFIYIYSDLETGSIKLFTLDREHTNTKNKGFFFQSTNTSYLGK